MYVNFVFVAPVTIFGKVVARPTLVTSPVRLPVKLVDDPVMLMPHVPLAPLPVVLGTLRLVRAADTEETSERLLLGFNGVYPNAEVTSDAAQA